MKTETDSVLFDTLIDPINLKLDSLSSPIQQSTNFLQEIVDSIRCLYKEEAIMMCCSQNCEKDAPLCGKKKCECKKQHKKCLNYFHLDHLLEMVCTKNDKKQGLVSEIERIFDILVDQISNLREKVIQAANFVFFNSFDQDFLQKLKNFDMKQIHGQNLYNCSFNLNEKKSIQSQQKNLSIMKTSLQNFRKKLDSEIHLFETNLFIEKLLMKKDELKTQRELDLEKISEILTANQLTTLNNFFREKPFDQMKLIYRASQNEFSTKKFWDLCTNIPNTLVVILTERHKVIGGYTPVPWQKYTSTQQQADPSNESFIFSLTEGQIFRPFSSGYATYYFNENWGPQFGRLVHGDLSISDKCNVEPLSFCFQGNVYVSEKNPGVEVDIERFTGQEKSKRNYFKIIDWEVFQLIF